MSERFLAGRSFVNERPPIRGAIVLGSVRHGYAVRHHDPVAGVARVDRVPQFRTALIWLTVAIIVFLAYISDSILQQRFDDQQTTTEQQGSQRFGPIAVPPVQKPL